MDIAASVHGSVRIVRINYRRPRGASNYSPPNAAAAAAPDLDHCANGYADRMLAQAVPRRPDRPTDARLPATARPTGSPDLSARPPPIAQPPPTGPTPARPNPAPTIRLVPPIFDVLAIKHCTPVGNNICESCLRVSGKAAAKQSVDSPSIWDWETYGPNKLR